MKTKLRSKVTLLFMTCALLIAIPAVAAIADTLAIKGDVLATGNSKNTTFTLCPGVGGSVDQKATINFQGSDHFANLATVNITASVPSAAQNFITASNGSVVTGTSSNAWNNNSDTVSTGNLPLTVDTDWVAGQYDVTYTATGQKAGAAAGTNLTLTDKSKITIEEATTGCQAPNEAPLVNVVGPEDGATYEINDVPAATCSVDDEDADAAADPVVGDVTGPLSAYGLGEQTVTCSYTDSSDETGTDDVTYTIADTGDPVITEQSHTPDPADGDNGWHISAVTTTFQAEDFNGSTPADVGAGFLAPLTNPYTLPDVDSGAAEGDDVSINSGTVEDVAGNVSNNASSGPYMIDLTDPTIDGSLSPAAAGTGWYNIATGPPTALFDCDDVDANGNAANASGVASCEDDHLFGEGENQSHQGTVTDTAGRSANDSVSNVDVDLTAPSVGTVSAVKGDAPGFTGATAYTANTWTNKDVKVSWSCTDTLSGPVNANGSQTVTAEGAAGSVTPSCADNAGNTANGTAFSPIKIDKTKPTVTVNGFNDGATGSTLPSSVTCTVTDQVGLSGAVEASPPPDVDDDRNGNGVGPVTYTCDGADNADNTNSASKTFIVSHSGVSGILQPINPDNTSVFSRGRSVPVKFQLGGDGAGTSFPNGFTTSGWTLQRSQVSCSTGFDLEDAVVESVPSNTPTTLFRYDASADQYIYNTDFRDKAAGTCWKVKVTLDDSTTVLYSAVFKMQK